MNDALKQTQAAESQYLLKTYDRYPVQFERGEGVYLFDSEGKRYTDFLSGIGVNALGYSHPSVTKVLQEQAAKLVHVSNLFHHPYQGALAKKLVELSGLDRAFFCNSGTEAWEAAIKLVRMAAAKSQPQIARPKLLAMKNSFHGRTIGSLATTGQEKYRKPFAPLMPEVEFVTFNDVAELEHKFDGSVAAILLETVQGEGGVVPVSAEFLTKARELTRESGALLALDEIQCGLGRTGRWFAYQHYGIVPDVVTLAKPIASGLPLGAVLCSDAVANAMQAGMHGTTFGGGPLACAVALETIAVMEREGLVLQNMITGSYLRGKLEALKAEIDGIKEVRGLGVMVGMELESAEVAKAVVSEMLAAGFLINRTHETVLRFLPPYIVAQGDIDSMVAALSGVLSSCMQALSAAHA